MVQAAGFRTKRWRPQDPPPDPRQIPDESSRACGSTALKWSRSFGQVEGFGKVYSGCEVMPSWWSCPANATARYVTSHTRFESDSMLKNRIRCRLPALTMTPERDLEDVVMCPVWAVDSNVYTLRQVWLGL